MAARPRMSESKPPDRLRRLGEEIDQARAQGAPERPGDGGDAASGGALGFGLRIGIELVSALCVGLALGWLADRYIGTRPWGLIAGFFLGARPGS